MSLLPDQTSMHQVDLGRVLLPPHPHGEDDRGLSLLTPLFSPLLISYGFSKRKTPKSHVASLAK